MRTADRQLRDCPAAGVAAKEKLHMKEMYEVLKFVEHGTYCSRTSDCIQGNCLMQYLKEHRDLDKKTVFRWFREIARSMQQYYHTGTRQSYRYLNPYSIIVGEDEKIMLLDLEAPDNAGVLKKMQTGAVRSHFVKPVCELGIIRNNEADIFAYGKTVQFILASTELRPEVTFGEGLKLGRMIRRCTGENGKRYNDFEKILKILPPVPAEQTKKVSGKRVNVKHVLGGAGLGAAACLCTCVVMGIEKKELVSAETQAIYEQAEAKGRETAKKEYEKAVKAREEQEEAERQREKCVAEIKAAAEKAEKKIQMERRLYMEQELLTMCDKLLIYETDQNELEKIRRRKEELEESRKKETGLLQTVSETAP